VKKNNLVIILILGLVVAVGILYLLKERNTTFSSRDTEFNIKDTSKIDKIIIKERNGKEILLTKKENNWIVSTGTLSYTAHKKQVELLLNTIYRIKVKAPVPKEGRKTILTDMAASAKEVIYMGDEKVLKHIFIGADTPDNLGTHMLLKDGDEPYITHIPGFFGYLSSRFTTDINIWRTKYIFTNHPKKIKEVSIEYPSEPVKSFKLLKNGEQFSLTHQITNNTKELPGGVAKSYFAQFKDFAVLRFLTEKEANLFIIDPINPFAVLQYVSDMNTSIKLYKIKQSGMMYGGDDLDDAEIDTENFILEIENNSKKEYAIGASRRLASLFPSYEGFFLNQQPE